MATLYTEPVKFEPAPPVAPEEEQWIKASGIDQTPVLSENRTDIRNGREAQIYDTTAKNPLVKGSMDITEIGTWWTGYDIVPQNDYKRYPHFRPIDDWFKDLFQWNIDSLNRSDDTPEGFDGSCMGIQRNSLEYGFQVAEMMPYYTGRSHCLRSITTKYPPSFDFYYNQAGLLDKFTYSGIGGYTERYRHNAEGKNELINYVITTFPYVRNDNYYGISELASIRMDVSALELLEQLEMKGVKAITFKPIIHYYDDNKSTPSSRETVHTKVTMIDGIAVISVPMEHVSEGETRGGVEIYKHVFKVMDNRTDPSGVAMIKDIIDRLQKRIMRALGVPDDLGFSSAGHGSYAKAKEEMSLFLSRVIRYQRFIEKFVNKSILGALITWNWTKLPDYYRPPAFKFRQLEENVMATMAVILLQLHQAGLLKAQDLQAMLDIPVLGDSQIKLIRESAADMVGDKAEITESMMQRMFRAAIKVERMKKAA